MSGQVEQADKEKALVLVERSHTFRRQEQLLAFLRYVCEQEFEGRGAELHEYLIGTEVLRQPPGYSTSENSIVRSRAHSLRRKLQDFYADEAPDVPIRIEIPKGSYCPHFVSRPAQAEPATPSGATETAAPSRTRGWTRLGLGILAFVMCGLCFWLGYWRGERKQGGQIDAVIRDTWGPLLGPGVHTTICIANAPQILVKAIAEKAPSNLKTGADLGLEEWYRERYKLQTGEHLYLLPTHNSPLWGDASGALIASQVLAKAEVETQVLPERAVGAFALRGINVILLGRPEYSPAAATFLQDMYYNMRYFEDVTDQEISYSDPATGQERHLPRDPGRTHGLITVIRSGEQSHPATEMVIVSGVNSAATEGAMEFFSSPGRMREFTADLKRDGYSKIPAAYQIVVSTEYNEVLPYHASMVAYRVVAR